MKNKKILTIALFLISLCAISQMATATNRTWNGTTSTAWGTASNWTPSGVPGVNDSVTIVSATNNPVLSVSVSVKRFTMTSGTLDLNTDTLTISNGFATFNGGTINNGLVKPRGSSAIYAGTTFGAKIDAITGSNKFNGSTFNNVTSFEDTSNTAVNSTGGNTWNAEVIIYKSGTGDGLWNIGTTYGNTFNGNLTVKNSGIKVIQFSDTGSSVYNGNIIVSNTGSAGISFGSNSGGTSILATGKTITVGTGFSDGTLLLRNFSQAGSTSQSITLTGTAVINFVTDTFNGGITITAPSILLKNTVFNNTASFTQSGSTVTSSYGGNQFNGTTTVTVTGSTNFRLGATTSDYFNSAVTFNGTNASILPGYGSEVFFKGNLTCNGSFNFKIGTVGKATFTGIAAQTIYSDDQILFGHIKIDKSANDVTLSTPVRVDSVLTFVKGKIISTSTNLFTIYTGASVTGASDSGFVSGPVKKRGNTSFVFPVGKGNEYRALEMTAPSVSTDGYIAEYFNTSQTLGTAMDTTIDYLSQCNYWNFERSVGTSNVTVKLNWNSSHCGILDSADLRIAQWDGTKWKDKSFGTFTGSISSGKLATPSALNTYGYYCLAYKKTALPTAFISQIDTNIETFPFAVVGTSNVSKQWYPDWNITCNTCDTLIVDTLETSVHFYLLAKDYKGRTAIDSVLLYTTRRPSSAVQILPPQLDWKEDDWAPYNTLDSYSDQTKEESGDEWWYGHANSYSGIPPTEADGYICAGYATFINTPYYETYNGCGQIPLTTSPECPDFETSLLIRGPLMTALALKPLNGKGYHWFETYGSGGFFNVIQTSDGGYVAVGTSNSTRNAEDNSINILYNPTGSNNDYYDCTTFDPADYKRKAYVVKVDKTGELEWEGIYAPFSDINTTYEIIMQAENVIQKANGDLRITGSYIDGSNHKAFFVDLDPTYGYLQGYSEIPNVFGFGIITDFHAWGITSYLNGSTPKDIISGSVAGTNGNQAYIMQISESTPTANVTAEWFNISAFPANLLNPGIPGNYYNTNNYYVKMATNTAQPEILMPVIDHCNGTAAGENFGVGTIYKFDAASGNSITTAPFPLNVGSVGAYDLKINVAPREGGGFGVLTSVHNVTPVCYADCNGLDCSPSHPPIPGNFNSDAYVANYTNDGYLEWETWWNIDDLLPQAYPGDGKKQECLYTITQADDGGFVVAGNTSYNFDDYYLCKLHSDCESRSAYSADIYDNTDNIIDINSNTPWNSSHKVKGSVHIKPGYTLTISGSSTVIEFTDSKKISTNGFQNPIETNIVVEPGGKLVVNDNATLTVIDNGGCDERTMWDGIQVWGDPASSNVNDQGWVDISGGAIIEHARIGILADKTYRNTETNEAIPWGTFGGGRVRVTDNVYFKENRYGIWFSPYPYVNNSWIYDSHFESNQLLRDEDYNYPFAIDKGVYKSGTVDFIHINNALGIKVIRNEFTSSLTNDNYLHGVGVSMYDASATITGNDFNNTGFGVRSLHAAFPNRLTYISDNDFNSVNYGVFMLDGAYSKIVNNSFNDIPDGIQGYKNYGIWMRRSGGYFVGDGNSFGGTATPEYCIGFISTNSNTLGGELSHNTFNYLTKGVQAERDNQFAQFRCNEFSNHTHAWNICPSGVGSLANQGTGILPNQKRAGNVFNDDCPSPPPYTHIKTNSVGFTYFGNDQMADWVPCANSPVVVSNGSFSDDESCDPDVDPCPTCLDEMRIAYENEENPAQKQLYLNGIIRYYLSDSTEEYYGIFDYLKGLRSSEANEMLMSLYLQENELDSAHKYLDSVLTGTYFDERVKQFDSLLVNLADSGKTLLQITDAQADLLLEIANDNTSDAQSRAQTALAIARDSVYFYEPEDDEEEHEERMAKDEIASNNGDDIPLDNIPNPYKDETVIRTIMAEDGCLLRITDIYGKEIYRKNLNAGNNEVVVSSAGITSGIYYYSIVKNGSSMKTKRMCIIK
ncbi:MAG: T9SS type A sorting domain-containing protein [Bacteroidia bacterium]